jgi:TonB family protein
MARVPSPYRQVVDALLGAYASRVLVGVLGSLTVVLLLVHLPYSSAPPTIGWSARAPERIPVSELRREADEPSDPSSALADAPPPTRSGPPQPDAPSSTGPDDGRGEVPDEPPNKTSNDSSVARDSVRAISALSLEDGPPEIVGGRGALYLHIRYPVAARQQGIEGRLRLEFTVGRDGSVRDVVVANSLHPLCDSAAVRALRSVQFRPGTHEGKPVPVRMHLPVRFELRSGTTPLRSSRRPGPGG